MGKLIRGDLAAASGERISSQFTGATNQQADLAPFRVEDFAGITHPNGKPILDHEGVIGQIDSGREIASSDDVFTFAFFDFQHALGLNNNLSLFGQAFGEGKGYTAFSEAEKAVAREAFILWDDLIPQSIVEIDPSSSGAKTWAQGTVDIWLANTTTGPGQAWAYLPTSSPNLKRVSSDVWTADPSANWTNDWLQYDGYGRTTLIHEIGHSFGLTHPGNYNATGPDGQPANPTYADDAEYYQDTEQFTIMSYFSPQLTGAQPINGALGILGNAQTPLLHDILTIQAKYGADPKTRVGDTNYFSNSNAGNAVYDLAQNPYPYLSVYDAGGEDTFDFSTANRSVFIDLRPGAFSSAAAGAVTLAQANAITQEFNDATDEVQGDFALFESQAEVDAYTDFLSTLSHNALLNNTGVPGLFATSLNNISIAYNTTIENANGGSARDYLFGNDVSNKLNGNGGDDVLDGHLGNDIYTGGTGADEFRVSQIGGDEVITDFTSGSDKIRLSEIDAIAGTAANDAFAFIGDADFSAAGQLRVVTVDGVNYVEGNVDGDLDADFTINLGAGTAVVTDFFL